MSEDAFTLTVRRIDDGLALVGSDDEFARAGLKEGDVLTATETGGSFRLTAAADARRERVAEIMSDLMVRYETTLAALAK